MDALRPFHRIHLIGIGGAGMSAIARVLLDRGFEVSGSDLADNALTRRLAALGARIALGHRAEHVAGADLVVTSTAIDPGNPERRAALEAGIPIWRRARVLAEIMRGGRSVAVSGTHGKTTTTSMVGLILARAGLDPTVLIGGEVNDFGGNARTGRGEWVVAEADESDGSLLEMTPDRIILTNIEADHLDFYRDHTAIVATFEQFIAQLRPGGKTIVCLDDPAAAGLAGRGTGEWITYALERPDAQYTARVLERVSPAGGPRFELRQGGRPLGELTLRIPGLHNVANALAAAACALDVGAPLDAIAAALSEFQGARRRFQVKGRVGGITVIDDYAHHPTEIAATLAAARERQAAQPQPGRIVAVFQPHRYSRTQALAAAFGRALCGSDVVIVTDVYSAGESPIEGVSGRLIYEQTLANGHREVYYRPTLDEAKACAADRLAPGDWLLTVGAGNVYKLGEALLAQWGAPVGSAAPEDGAKG